MRAYLPVARRNICKRRRRRAQMFNSYNWGGYLMFALPDMPVFVDGRTDLYGDTFPDCIICKRRLAATAGATRSTSTASTRS